MFDTAWVSTFYTNQNHQLLFQAGDEICKQSMARCLPRPIAEARLCLKRVS
jgi:hypothetical protein